jgi:hypothetical protein
MCCCDCHNTYAEMLKTARGSSKMFFTHLQELEDRLDALPRPVRWLLRRFGFKERITSRPWKGHVFGVGYVDSRKDFRSHM